MKFKNTVIIDVREKDEFNAEHIHGSINIPMTILDDKEAKNQLKEYKWKDIIILCQSWNRAKLSEKFIEKNCKCNVRIYEWWIVSWKNQGNKTNKKKKFYVPLIKQVQIIVWFLVLMFAFLTYFVDMNFIFWVMAVSSGLFFAWITGTCLLANIIAKLPFNKMD